jgi:hypothetical protein
MGSIHNGLHWLAFNGTARVSIVHYAVARET